MANASAETPSRSSLQASNSRNKFKDKYRIASTRATWHSYRDGFYFITICVKGHLCLLGKISDGEMVYSPLGKKTSESIEEIPQHYPDIRLGEYIVMPNHLHLVLGLLEAEVPKQEHYGILAKAVSGLKSSVKHFANTKGVYFEWQSRYHDRIIRNQEEHIRIDEYIRNNVCRWADDCYYR